MSSRKERRAAARASGRASGRGTRGRGGAGASRIALILLALAALGGATWAALAWRAAPKRAAGPEAAAAPTTAALAESAAAAEAVGNWTRVIASFEQLALRDPKNAELQLALGAAWNNYVWAGGRDARHGARTSLERIGYERRALQCLDSAAVLAQTDDEFVKIRLMRGRIYEAMGLPLDGLAQYQDARRRMPTNPEAAGRMTATARRLNFSNRPTEPR